MRVVFDDLKFESMLTMNVENSLSRNSITTSKSNSVISIPSRSASIIDPTNSTETTINQFDLRIDSSENQTTLDLLEKIRQTAHAEQIGPMPLSLQVC